MTWPVYGQAQDGAQSPAGATSKISRIGAISVAGTKLPANEVVSASGLSVGEMVSADQLQAAATRLSIFGLFSKINYRYTSKGDSLFVEFELDDAPTVPLWFDNFPWLADDEIAAAIRGDVGLFPGSVPTSGELVDEIDAVIEKLLASRKIEAHVTHQLIASPFDDGMIMEFRAADTNVRVQSLQFGDALASNSEQLKDRVTDVVGQPYSRLATEVFINEHVRPLYAAQGNLHAKIGPPQPHVVIDVEHPTQSAVDMVLPIIPGPTYKWSGVHWQGNSLIPAADLDKLLGFMPGDVADGMKVQAGWQQVEEEYGRRGYLDAKLEFEPQFDELSHQAAYEVHITEGPQYRMGEMIITGLSYDAESRLREIWRVGKGQIFDQAYFDQMLPLLAKPNPQIFGTMPVHYDQFGHFLRPDPQHHTVDVLLDFK